MAMANKKKSSTHHETGEKELFTLIWIGPYEYAYCMKRMEATKKKKDTQHVTNSITLVCSALLYYTFETSFGSEISDEEIGNKYGSEANFTILKKIHHRSGGIHLHLQSKNFVKDMEEKGAKSM